MKRIIYDYENPHIVGKAKHSVSLAKIIVCIITISLAAALIYILFFKDSSAKCASKEYFALVTNRFDTESEAASAAALVSDKGGGGYVVDGATYSVIASVYENRADADRVAQRYGWEVESTGSYTVKVGVGSGEINKEALELFVYPEQIINELYALSLEVDKGEISSVAAAYALNALSDRADEKARALFEIQKNFSDKLFDRANEMYDEIARSLSAECRYSVSSHIKYCLCEVTFTYKKFLIAIS